MVEGFIGPVAIVKGHLRILDLKFWLVAGVVTFLRALYAKLVSFEACLGTKACLLYSMAG